MAVNGLISIIIPVYNRLEFLGKCLDSIRAQSYKQLEIIVVDDGSSDGSAEFLDEYSKKDDRIKVVHKLNGGSASARNVGLKHTTGSYIGFIDSDDYIEKDFYLNLITSISENEEFDMAITGFKSTSDAIVYQHYNLLEAGCNVELSGDEVIKKSVEKGGYRWRLLWNKLYKRELFDGVTFREGKIIDDEFVCYDILLKCKKCIYVPEEQYIYVYHSESVMHATYTEKNFCLGEAFVQNAVKVMPEKKHLKTSVLLMVRAIHELKKARDYTNNSPSQKVVLAYNCFNAEVEEALKRLKSMYPKYIWIFVCLLYKLKF